MSSAKPMLRPTHSITGFVEGSGNVVLKIKLYIKIRLLQTILQRACLQT